MAEDDPERIPAALLEKPELPEHLGDVFEAIQALNRSRPVALGIGGGLFQPIPVRDALAMASAIGWPPLDFLRVIGPADDLYVERLNQRNRT